MSSTKPSPAKAMKEAAEKAKSAKPSAAPAAKPAEKKVEAKKPQAKKPSKDKKYKMPAKTAAVAVAPKKKLPAPVAKVKTAETRQDILTALVDKAVPKPREQAAPLAVAETTRPVYQHSATPRPSQGPGIAITSSSHVPRSSLPASSSDKKDKPKPVYGRQVLPGFTRSM